MFSTKSENTLMTWNQFRAFCVCVCFGEYPPQNKNQTQTSPPPPNALSSSNPPRIFLNLYSIFILFLFLCTYVVMYVQYMYGHFGVGGGLKKYYLSPLTN